MTFINSLTIGKTQEEITASRSIIINAYKEKIKLRHDFLRLQKNACEEFEVGFLTSPVLLQTYRDLIKEGVISENKDLFNLLRKRIVRTTSGIAAVAVLTKAWPCPGKCIYCPTEIGMPKSYLSNEPAVMRAILAKFDAYRQVQIRLRGLDVAGNPSDKIELIVMGGTFSALTKTYQLGFISRCYQACNEYGRKGKRKNEPLDCARGRKRKITIPNLKILQRRNETVKHRIVGLTLETRPDYINEKEIKWFRDLGCTRVELGVQSVFDDVLERNQRGHGIEATIKATKLLKDAGFKVCYHLMPNLYGSSAKRDLEMFKILFSDERFQPDLIKIYPCMLTKYSKLERLYREGKFVPYSDKELINLLIKIKQIIPPYVRIQRLYRDIPASSIIAGSKMSNIRQIMQEKMLKENIVCQCIRCREIRTDSKLPVKLNRIDYEASGGKEIFLEYIDKNNRLYALLRLRLFGYINNERVAIIREVHTYGPMAEVGVHEKISKQHKGLGKKLIKEAEKIVYTEFCRGAKKESKLKKIAVISGVGVRGYYRKLGYKLNSTYMIKKL